MEELSNVFSFFLRFSKVNVGGTIGLLEAIGRGY